MEKKLFVLTMLFLFVSQGIWAQHMGMMRRERLRRMEQLEKAKLIELLNMDDKTAIKFFAIRNENIQKQKDLNKIKNRLTDSLRAALKLKEERKYSLLIKKIIRADKALAKNRLDYFNALKKVLSKEQLAKLIVFEATFRNEIKRMLFRRHMME